MQDLVDLCFSQWNHEIHALDASYTTKTPLKDSFLSQLPVSAQEDCLELIQTLRSNPRFLVERFKAMSPSQMSALATFPRFQELSESVLTSLSQNRGRASQRKRIKAYSKELEDYASSFERSNPLSFLLHNIYGCLQDIESSESRLRFSTWSTICSSLMVDFEQGFHAIISQVLGAFANLYEWHIKERLELFLMSILQRGAFLLDMVENPAGSPHSEFGPFDPFSTQQAQEFFDGGIKELFEILACDGGIPVGALHLGQAIIGKIPTIEGQSQFRGHFFFQWFMQEFLRIAITYPEVCLIRANIARANLARMKKCFFIFISATKPGHTCCIGFGIAPWLGPTVFSAQCKLHVPFQA
jgi:chromatin assembly factor 1 subunit A